MLERKQLVKSDINVVWDYFSSPDNLNEMTPTNMGFRIITQKPIPKMFLNQEIEYKVRPVLNIPLYWKTKITEVKPKEHFVDEQMKGPYSLWRHKHTFIPKGGHIEMHDRVDYALPFGILGSVAHSIYVNARLKEIFDYRATIVDKVFNQD